MIISHCEPFFCYGQYCSFVKMRCYFKNIPLDDNLCLWKHISVLMYWEYVSKILSVGLDIICLDNLNV
jgi:hypothetical protein